jgi:hypothetical protein
VTANEQLYGRGIPLRVPLSPYTYSPSLDEMREKWLVLYNNIKKYLLIDSSGAAYFIA